MQRNSTVLDYHDTGTELGKMHILGGILVGFKPASVLYPPSSTEVSLAVERTAAIPQLFAAHCDRSDVMTDAMFFAVNTTVCKMYRRWRTSSV